MSNAPYFFDYINSETSQITPSTVHVKNTSLSAFFRRYLFQKAISVFKWNLPENWEENYFLYTLYGYGYNAIIYTDKFGVIPQACGLGGYSVQYQPTFVTIANPHFKGIKQPVINEDCVLMRLQPNYCGIIDIVNYYGDLMALASEAVSFNLLNSKLAYVFTTGNKAGAEAMKKMYDKIASGEPAVVYDKSYNTDSGEKPWDYAFNHLKENFIAPDLLSSMRKIEAMFDTDIGIPNSNTDKKERLIVDEVNSNNAETLSKCSLWLDHCKKGCNKINQMFGNYLQTEITVDWRFKTDLTGVNNE